MKKFLILFSILFCTFFYGQVTYAQFNVIKPPSISVETLPEIPKPNQKVMITVDSYETDLNKAKITWSVNGKVELSGKGEKVFYFTTGSLNTTTRIDLVVVTSTGETLKNSYNIRPTSVDIIWQNESYVPPFYEGKAMFSYQNKITFIAVPHITNSNGVEIDPSTLIYKWTKNGTVAQDYSGYGKSTYTIIPTIISRPIKMEVEVTSPTSDVIAYSSVYVEPKDPMIIMYEKNPLYGFMFEKALTGNITLQTKEMEVTVSPYFFGTRNKRVTDLPYIWEINGNKIDSDTTVTSRTFRPREGTVGSSNISVSIDNINKVLQSASASFNLNFDSTNNTDTTI